MTVPPGSSPRLRLLLDSNVFITVEPYAGTIESGTATAASLVRLANEQGHLLCVAQATRDDLLQGRDRSRLDQRLVELQKFHLLVEVPVSAELIAAAGASATGSNDHRDLRILAALHAGAATHLITEDSRLRRRARRAGLGDAVLSLIEAVDLLGRFAPSAVEPPPRVKRIPTYALDVDQRIFDSLRADYKEFDDWLRRVRVDSDNRTCFLVTDQEIYAAIALLKSESHCEYAIADPVTKISTFKVAGSHAGVKYGELLLKAVLKDAFEQQIRSLYVEVLPSHPEVIDFFQDFGFRDQGSRTARGERVLVKELGERKNANCTDLDYHILYGPPALRPTQNMFIVPIQPRWHNQLFPEQAGVSEQPSLFAELDVPSTFPWGNALRKAYLCNAPTRSVRQGDLLLFYRSQDSKAITALGIVEATLRSVHAEEVVTFVGRRTVYSPQEIAQMCRSRRGVLAIRFRQDRFVEPSWEYTELQLAGVLTAWPQTIIRVPPRAQQWVRDHINE